MDAEAIRDLFEPFGPVSLKRMLSGHGVFADDVCVSLVLRGEVYMKADAQTWSTFEAAGSRPFSYARPGRDVVMTSYWLLPPQAFDDPDDLRSWCERWPPRAGSRPPSGRRA